MLSRLSCAGLSNPVDMVFHLQPVMILALLPIAVPVDGKEDNSVASDGAENIECSMYLL